jgi:hypothetical protein
LKFEGERKRKKKRKEKDNAEPRRTQRRAEGGGLDQQSCSKIREKRAEQWCRRRSCARDWTSLIMGRDSLIVGET